MFATEADKYDDSVLVDESVPRRALSAALSHARRSVRADLSRTHHGEVRASLPGLNRRRGSLLPKCDGPSTLWRVVDGRLGERPRPLGGATSR